MDEFVDTFILVKQKLLLFFEIFGYFGVTLIVVTFLLFALFSIIPSIGFWWFILILFGGPILSIIAVIPIYRYFRRFRKLSLLMTILGFLPALWLVLLIIHSSWPNSYNDLRDSIFDYIPGGF